MKKLIIKETKMLHFIRAKYYYENDKERLKKQAKDKYRNLSEQKEKKGENMEEIDIIICLKKRNKN